MATGINIEANTGYKLGSELVLAPAVQNLNGDVKPISPLEEVAVLYDRRYARSTNGIFSQQDGTPLLNALIRELLLIGKPLRAVDIGAGPGVHSVEMATQVTAVEVIAIDTSRRAINRIRRVLPRHESQFAAGSSVNPVRGDISRWLSRQQPHSVDIAYGSSFGHFLPEQVEGAIYRLAYAAQPLGGFIAISQKGVEDGLLQQPTTHDISEEADWIRATPEDGIRRRFLKTPEVLAQRLSRIGYERILWQSSWQVPDYDSPGIVGSFVGVLAQKVE